MIERLREALPENVDIIVLADRGFGDFERYAQLDELGWYYAIRFRGGVRMSVQAKNRFRRRALCHPVGE